MKADGLFVIMAIVFIFIAWVATGGPTRAISQSGPYITPVTRPGEESQGYRYIVPANPIDPSSYPKQIAGSDTSISSGADSYTRSQPANKSSYADSVYFERSTLGPVSGNPNQEYMSIRNSGTVAVALNGWRITSTATGATMTIPSVTLLADQTLIIVSGRVEAGGLRNSGVCTQNTICVSLYRNLEMFAPTRETITLYDASGKVVDSFSY